MYLSEKKLYHLDEMSLHYRYKWTCMLQTELVLLWKSDSYAVLTQCVRYSGLWINKFQNEINSVRGGCYWLSWKVLCMHCYLLYAPENPAAELLVATLIIVGADDVSARGQMEELDVIVSVIHVKVLVFLKTVLTEGANPNIHFCLETLGILITPLIFTHIQLQMLNCFFNVLYCSATSCLETRYFLITNSLQIILSKLKIWLKN